MVSSQISNSWLGRVISGPGCDWIKPEVFMTVEIVAVSLIPSPLGEKALDDIDTSSIVKVGSACAKEEVDKISKVDRRKKIENIKKTLDNAYFTKGVIGFIRGSFFIAPFPPLNYIR